MVFSLSTYWNYGSIYGVIEHKTSPDGEPDISCLTAVKGKGEFEIKKTFKTKAVSGVSDKLQRNQHCFLILASNQVLLKTTPVSGNDKKIIGTAFPNIDINEFYYQILKTPTQNFVALCRKEHVHQVIDSYQGKNIKIIGFSLSFFAVQNLLGLLKKEEIHVSNYLIHKSQNEISSFAKKKTHENEKTYQIADTSVNSEFLLALGGLFNYETQIQNTVSNFETKNKALRKEHQQQVFFRKGLLAGTGILLLALLINFFLFSTFYSEHQRLTEQYQVELLREQTYNKKQLEIGEKEKIVANIFNNSNSKSSFYLNGIISQKPASILFQEFTYQPLEKPVKAKEPVQLVNDQIRIRGESRNETLFSEWIKGLEKIPWLSSVKVSGFSYKTTNISEFNLILNITGNETIH